MPGSRRPICGRDGAAVPSVFTVHNLAYQGFFPAAFFADLALPPGFFSIDGVEFYGGLSLHQGRAVLCRPADDGQPDLCARNPDPGLRLGLDGLLRTRAGELTGILNGVDPAIWSPENDPLLPRRYSARRCGGRQGGGESGAAAPLRPRRRTATAPLFGAVTRLTPQKGLDLLLAALPGLIALGGRLVLLGSGDADLEAGFARPPHGPIPAGSASRSAMTRRCRT